MLYYFLHFTLNKYAKTTLDTCDILDKNSSSKEIANSLKEKVNYYANYKKDMAKQDSEREKKLKQLEKKIRLLIYIYIYIK